MLYKGGVELHSSFHHPEFPHDSNLNLLKKHE